MNESTIFHAWFSEKAETSYGSFVYLDENGNQVVVTCVARNKDLEYNWPDKVYRGIVTKPVGPHKIGIKKSLTFFKETGIL